MVDSDCLPKDSLTSFDKLRGLKPEEVVIETQTIVCPECNSKNFTLRPCGISFKTKYNNDDLGEEYKDKINSLLTLSQALIKSKRCDVFLHCEDCNHHCNGNDLDMNDEEFQIVLRKKSKKIESDGVKRNTNGSFLF